MASKLKLQNDIKKLEAAIKSKKTPAKLLPALKKQLEKAKDELAAATKAKRQPKASVVKQTSQTIKDLLAKKEYSVYKGAGVDLERDAGRPALKTGKRISKNGNTYYEYRANRVDVNPRRYPKLEKGGSISAETTYVPNRDVKELMVVLSGEVKQLKGKDIKDGVYVRKSALSQLKSKKSIATDNVDVLMKQIIEKAKTLSGFEAKKSAYLRKEDVQKLLSAGYTKSDLMIIYCGASAINDIKCDNEFSGWIGGILQYSENSYVQEAVDAYLNAAKNNRFELGIKYPDFNWTKIVQKYGISKTPDSIEKSKKRGDVEYVSTFSIYKGANVVLGTITKRVTIEKNGKKNIDEDTPPITNGQFNGGYWGIVSSSKEVILDIIKMVVSQKNGYVKDMEVFWNMLGGVGAKELDSNGIKYAKGGMINHGLQMGDRIVEVYKGYGIVEDSTSSLVVVNPEKGERHPVNDGADYDTKIVAAKKMIDESSPINVKLMDEESMRQFAKGGQVHKLEAKNAVGGFSESEFKQIICLNINTTSKTNKHS